MSVLAKSRQDRLRPVSRTAQSSRSLGINGSDAKPRFWAVTSPYMELQKSNRE